MPIRPPPTPAVMFAIAAIVFATPFGAAAIWSLGGLAAATADALTRTPRLWACLLTELTAALTASWVWSLKPRDRTVWLFAASGASTYAFCAGAAAFVAPGPLAPDILSAAAFVNVFGACGFGLAVIALLARYPRRLPAAAAATWVSVLGFGGWPWRALTARSSCSSKSTASPSSKCC